MSLKSILLGILSSRITSPESALSNAIVRSGDWTPVVLGNTTAGTYEAVLAIGRYTRIGTRVMLDFWFQAAAAITAGGTGALAIDGLPFAKMSGTVPQGAILMDGIAWTAGTDHTVGFNSAGASSRLLIYESVNNAVFSLVGIAGLGINDRLFGSISYETGDA